MATEINIENEQLKSIAQQSYNRLLQEICENGTGAIRFDERLLKYDKEMLHNLNIDLVNTFPSMSFIEWVFRCFATDVIDNVQVDNIPHVTNLINPEFNNAKRHIIVDNTINRLKDYEVLQILNITYYYDRMKNTLQLLDLLKYLNEIRNKMAHINYYTHITDDNERNKTLLQYIIDKSLYPVADGLTFYAVLQAFDKILMHHNKHKLANFVTSFEQFVEVNKNKLPLLTELIPKQLIAK